ADYTGWRGLFLILAAYGIASFFLVTFFFKESLSLDNRLPISPKSIISNYAGLVVDRSFIGFALAGGFSMGGMFAFIASSSTVLMETFGLGPQGFARSFALIAFGLMVGSQLCGFLLRRGIPAIRLYRFAACWLVFVLGFGVFLSLTAVLSLTTL